MLLLAPSAAFLAFFSCLLSLKFLSIKHHEAFFPDVFSCRYKKTQETISQAGQKTSAAISTVSDVVARKLGDMR